MRNVERVLAAAVVLGLVGAAQAANVYTETGAGLGVTTPPPSGTQEFGQITNGQGVTTYYYDGTAGRTAATADAGPSLTFGTDKFNQIRPVLINASGTGGDVDLFKIKIDDPSQFRAWTGRFANPNNFLLTLFKADGTAVAASLGGVQVGNDGRSVVAYSAPLSAAPLNGLDSAGVISGAALGLAPGDYLLGVSLYNSGTLRGQPKNDNKDNIFTLVAGSVVTPNALADIKLSTDALIAWNLAAFDGGTVGSFDLGTDRLLGTSGFTAGSQAFINIAIPEPTSLGYVAVAGLGLLARRSKR